MPSWPPPAPARSATERSGSLPSKPSCASEPERWATTPSDHLERQGEPGLARRQALIADRSLTGAEFCRALTSLIDEWLQRLLGDARDVALVAVGGYGRRELCPGSDIDVLLVHRGRADVGAVAERVWYPLWDAGLKLGHATRKVKEAVAFAEQDLEAATAALDARHVAGDRELTAELSARARAQWEKRGRQWLATLARSVEERHDRAGEVAFLLEPDLKEGRGGLRDVHALRWAEAAHRVLVGGDDEAVSAAHDSLLAVRVELHRRTGKAGDRLFLQEQDGVAEALNIDADELMARVASAARVIAWTSDDAWGRITSSLRGPTGRLARSDRRVGAGLLLREEQLHLAPDADPAGDPSLVLRAAAAAAHAGATMARGTLDRLAAEARAPGDPWPEEARASLVSLLGAGRAAIPVLEALDHRGLLERQLPEWGHVRSLPQRNAYHRFTVDRHLCEAAAEAAALTRRVSRPDLLLIGAWLHDIGKGYGGDHTEAGVQLMATIASRMGFGPSDVGTLVALVRHHLLLYTVATRRDLTDPATASSVAAAVGDVTTLELLAALTEADSKATGETAWSSWKESLVQDLVARTAKVLSGTESSDAPSTLTPEQRALMDEARQLLAERPAEVLVLPRPPRLVVVAPDRPGLFCRVAGTLALHNLDVLAAEAWSNGDGLAFESFRVEHAFAGEPAWDRFQADLVKVLSGEVSLEARLAQRARHYRRPAPAAPRSAEPRVIVHHGASEAATVVEVRAADAMGLLYRVTKALAALDLDVDHAKVQTLGHEVVDTFYVREREEGGKIGHHRVDDLERAVLAEIAETTR